MKISTPFRLRYWLLPHKSLYHKYYYVIKVFNKKGDNFFMSSTAKPRLKNRVITHNQLICNKILFGKIVLKSDAGTTWK